MFPDFKELLSIFHARGVKYLIVGGYAVSLHAQPRATKDIDLLIKADAENAAAVFDALVRFGAPLEGLGPEDFTDRKKFFRMRQAGRRVSRTWPQSARRANDGPGTQGSSKDTAPQPCHPLT